MSHIAQNQRQLRVGEEIRHIISEIFQRSHFRDPVLQDIKTVTVSEVQISPDLKNATVYVMPLGGKNLEEIVGALNHAHGYIRSELAKRSKLRFIPRLHFSEDISYQQAHHIEEILKSERVAKDLLKADENEADSE